MKTLVVILTLAAATKAYKSADLSFDSIDLKQYEDNDNLIHFVSCMANPDWIDECTDMEINIRERAPDIVATNCGDCTDNEKEAVAFLTSKVAFIDENNSDLTKLLQEFDPRGENSKKYLEALNNFETKRTIPKLPDYVIDKYATSCFD